MKEYRSGSIVTVHSKKARCNSSLGDSDSNNRQLLIKASPGKYQSLRIEGDRHSAYISTIV